MKISSPSLVQVATSDNIYLQGYFVSGKGSKAILHIHGFEGNFYENKFVQLLAERSKAENLSFLTVNTRGSEKIKDFNTTDEKITTIGARYELIEDCHIDIGAWVRFLLEKGYKDIILSGHSLGTYKVVRYLLTGRNKDSIKKLILLAPFDKKAGLEIYTKKPLEETLKSAQKMVDSGRGEEMVTDEFDSIVLSYKTYVSWYSQDEFGRMFEFSNKNYDFPVLKKINVPTKIIVGSKDEYFYPTNPEHPKEAMDILLKNIPNSTGKIIDGAVHSFAPHQDIMVDEAIEFIKK
ncbi:MAG TPA: DUF1749 domain-containing protein [Patescibacteria group bacterium]|nr:DUF1749 domain-containing protein [Patescibacteria group bacterium]